MAGWCRLRIVNSRLSARPGNESGKGKEHSLEWTPGSRKAPAQLQHVLMPAPALALTNLDEPFEPFVHERQHAALGTLAQKVGSWKRPGSRQKRIRMMKHQVALLEQDAIELNLTNAFNSAHNGETRT
uniref:Uncharacterized protein n=1 Tax=Amazona collaria TaxID=241587 RepID=A0A8B9GIM1_9PSIT